MQINHNIPALRALNSLNKVSSVADKHMRNLSSGLRINSAADDAAGMAISNKMRTQVKGLKRASMNAEDGISLVQTAEGALSEVHSMLQRMRELAVQGANGTLKTEDRRAIQMEVEQLKQEITSTANLTEFNKVTLLDGQLDKRSFTDKNTVAQSAYVSDTVEPGKYDFDVVAIGAKANKTMTTAMNVGAAGITAAQVGIININGEEVKITKGMTKDEVFAAVRDLAETVDLTLTRDASDKITLTSNEAGSKQKITIFSDNANLLTAAGLDAIPESSAITGSDAVIKLDSTSSFGKTATVTSNGNRLEITDSNYKKVYIDLSVTDDGKSLKNGTTTLPPTVDGKATVIAAAPKSITVGGATFAFNAATVGANYNGYTVNFVPSGVPKATTASAVATNAAAKTINITYANDAVTSEMEALLDSVMGGAAAVTSSGTFTPPATSSAASITGGVTAAAATAPSNIKLGGLEFSLATGDTYNGYTINFEKNTVASTAAVVNATDKTITVKYDNTTQITSLTAAQIATAVNTATSPTNLLTVVTAGNYDPTLATSPKIGETPQGTLTSLQSVTLNVLDAGPLQLQVGANEGMKIEVQIPELTATALGLEFINLRTSEGAGEAITLCDKAIAEISAVRSKLGAYQNRLEYTINNLNATEENTTAALSRIEDADMASEMAEYTQKNVISQAGMSMLTKANQRPEQVLQLLQ
jgi:flagellin